MVNTDGIKRGAVDILLLSLLEEGEMYGYQLCQELNEKSHGLFTLQEGSLYPILYRMLDRGYISDRTEKVGKRRTRVYYKLEEPGKTYLEEMKKEYFSLTRGIMFVLGKGDLEGFLNEGKREE